MAARRRYSSKADALLREAIVSEKFMILWPSRLVSSGQLNFQVREMTVDAALVARQDEPVVQTKKAALCSKHPMCIINGL